MRQCTLIANVCVLAAATFALGIAAAWYHAGHPEVATFIVPTSFSSTDLIVTFSIMVVGTVVLARWARIARGVLPLLMAVMLISGAQVVFSVWFGFTTSIVAALGTLILMYAVPFVGTHDVSMGIGIAGVAAVLGLSLSPLVACVVLAALACYDILSVYRTRTMVGLAGRMITSGTVLGLLIPDQLRGFFRTRQQALQDRTVMVLGSGDIALPLVLAAATAPQSLSAAAIVAIAALSGIVLMQVLFLRQRTGASMAALPPIAASAILGYAATLLL